MVSQVLERPRASVPMFSNTAGLLPLWELRCAAVTHIFGEGAGLSDDKLAVVRHDIASRIAVASGFQLTERDVVRALFRPVLSNNGRCRCPSCRECCPFCLTAHTPDGFSHVGTAGGA
jgi:hypothetical protein